MELQFFDIFFLQIQAQFPAHIHWDDDDHWICSLLRIHGQAKSWDVFIHIIQGESCDLRQEASSFLTTL